MTDSTSSAYNLQAPQDSSSSLRSNASDDSSTQSKKVLKRYLAARQSAELLPVFPAKMQIKKKEAKHVRFGSYHKPPVSPTSILRVKGDLNAKEKLLEKQKADKKWLEVLKSGSTLEEYILFGMKRQRFFYVSEDGTELYICKPSLTAMALKKKPTPERVILLADVDSLYFGPRTEGFGEYDWIEGRPYNCFSILLGNQQTVDIECPDRETFVSWYMGMQTLSPLSFSHVSRGILCWYRGYCISLIKSRVLGVSLDDMWHGLVAEARAACSQEELSNKSSSLSSSVDNKIRSKSSVVDMLFRKKVDSHNASSNKSWVWNAADSSDNSDRSVDKSRHNSIEFTSIF